MGMRKMLNTRLLCLTGILGVLLSGCSQISDFMDSSIGPEDQKYPPVQNARPSYTNPNPEAENTPAAQSAPAAPSAAAPAAAAPLAAAPVQSGPVIQTGVPVQVSPAVQTGVPVQNTAVPGQTGTAVPAAQGTAVSSVPQAGVIKPYIPDEVLQNPDNLQGYQSGTAAGIVTGTAAAGTAAAGTAAAAPAQTTVLPPVDSYTAAEVASMPVYASTSGRRSCDPRLNNSMLTIAPNLASVLCSKLNVETGKIYVAPTVIPSEYADCLTDVSSSVKAGIQKTGKFAVTGSGQASTVQNYGPRIIPELVRACRRDSIPYLAVSSVHKIGGKPALTIRIIRVSDGVTLTQRYQQLQAS